MSCVCTPTRGRGEGVDVDDIEGSGSVVVGGVGVCVYPGYTIERVCVYPGYIRGGYTHGVCGGYTCPRGPWNERPKEKKRREGGGRREGRRAGRRGGGASGRRRVVVSVCVERGFSSRDGVVVSGPRRREPSRREPSRARWSCASMNGWMNT